MAVFSIRLGTVLAVVVLVCLTQALALRCYHDRYVENRVANETTPQASSDENSLLVKRCGVLGNCKACVKITTEVERYVKEDGRKVYRVVSRVCAEEISDDQESGCDRMGPRSHMGQTNICHCFTNLCNN